MTVKIAKLAKCVHDVDWNVKLLRSLTLPIQLHHENTQSTPKRPQILTRADELILQYAT